MVDSSKFFIMKLKVTLILFLCLVQLLLLCSAGITAMAPTLQDLVDTESAHMKTKTLPRRKKFLLL